MLIIQILIFLRDYPSIQILLIFIISVLSQIYLIKIKPYTEKFENYFSLFNEFLVSIYALSFIGITDINNSIEAKNIVGMIQIFIVSILIVTNLIVLFV